GGTPAAWCEAGTASDEPCSTGRQGSQPASAGAPAVPRGSPHTAPPAKPAPHPEPCPPTRTASPPPATPDRAPCTTRPAFPTTSPEAAAHPPGSHSTGSAPPTRSCHQRDWNRVNVARGFGRRTVDRFRYW